MGRAPRGRDQQWEHGVNSAGTLHSGQKQNENPAPLAGHMEDRGLEKDAAGESRPAPGAGGMMQNSKVEWQGLGTHSGLAVWGPYALLLRAVLKLGWRWSTGGEGGAVDIKEGFSSQQIAAVQSPSKLLSRENNSALRSMGKIQEQALRLLLKYNSVLVHHFPNASLRSYKK